jgi:phosphate-selective porin OprO and OprP
MSLMLLGITLCVVGPLARAATTAEQAFGGDSRAASSAVDEPAAGGSAVIRQAGAWQAPDSAAPVVRRLPAVESPVSSPKQPAIARLPAPSTDVLIEPPPEELPGAVSPEVVQRLEQLERSLAETRRDLQERSQPEMPAPPRSQLFPPLASLPFPRVQLIGELQTDVALFNQDALNRATVGDALDGVDFRRARLAAVGQTTEFTDFRLEVDFALPDRPAILDVYLSQYQLPVLGNIRVGHFFEPFGMSRIIDNRFDIFMERPLLTVFAPARRMGFMSFGMADDGSATWAASLYTSDDNFSGGNLTDVGGWAGAGRVTWLPYYDETSGGRHYLHLGGAYSLSGVTNHQLQFSTAPELQLVEGNNFEPIFLNTGIISARQYQLIGTEFIWTEGPWSMQSEYVWVPIDTIGGPTATLQGAYVMGSYFLTGEHRPYDRTTGNLTRVIPYEDFFRVRGRQHLSGGKGAWQLAGRWSYLNFNGGDIRAGVLNDLTFGVNWYWNPFVRVYFNYVHAILDDVVTGTSHANAFGLRFQLDF